MKKLFLIGFVFFTLSITSQELLPKSIYTLNDLGVKTQNFDLNDELVQLNLNMIIYHNRKVTWNRIFAYIFTVYGSISALSGSYLIYQDSTERYSSVYKKTFGTVYLLSGLIQGSASIPFWIGAKKNKKKRNKLILKFQ
jgi:hypothetical protein